MCKIAPVVASDWLCAHEVTCCCLFSLLPLVCRLLLKTALCVLYGPAQTLTDQRQSVAAHLPASTVAIEYDAAPVLAGIAIC